MNTSIRDLYSIAYHNDNKGLYGYKVDKKYVDLRGIKGSEIKSNTNLVKTIKKKTFIDEIQYVASKFPGPSTYEIDTVKRKSYTVDTKPKSSRMTIFDYIAYLQKKYNHPSAGVYDKISTEADPKKLRPSFSKAENSTYLYTQMRRSLEAPGVGNYNSHQPISKKGSKWGLSKRKIIADDDLKFPPVGTYNPNPVAFELFYGRKKSKISHFSREERFKETKEKKSDRY